MLTSSLHLTSTQAFCSPTTRTLATTATATPTLTLIDAAHLTNRLATKPVAHRHSARHVSQGALVSAHRRVTIIGSGNGSACVAAPLHPTRKLRALTPVTVAHSTTFGSFRHSNRAAAGTWWRSSTETASRVNGDKLDRVKDPFQGVFLPIQGTTEVELTRRSPVPPPDFPLDRLPVYEPHDQNGPPRTKIGFHLPMRTLPASLAVNFFFPGADSGSNPQGAHASRSDGNTHSTGWGPGRGEYSEDYDDASARSDEYQESTSRFISAGGGKGGSSAAGAGSGTGDTFTAFCRLCRESFDNEGSLRTHITVADRARHVSHPVREVALETLTLLAVRGYPIDDVMTVWADILYNCPLFPRIRGMTNPWWSIEKRAAEVGTILRALKEVGVLDVALATAELAEMTGSLSAYHRRRRVAFERLEYIGDNCWGNNISNRILLLYPDQQWLYSERCSTFTLLRDACEMNVNLEFVFDTLELWHLLSSTAHSRLGNGKVKADLVEGILGELHLYLYGMVPKLQDDVDYVETNGAREVQLVALVEHCLTELYDLIVLKHARDLVTSAIPLAKELAAKRIWAGTRPFVLPQKRPHSGRARNKSATNSGAPHAPTFPSAVPAVVRASTAGPAVSLPSSRTGATATNAAVPTLEDLFDVEPSPSQQQQHDDFVVYGASGPRNGVFSSGADALTGVAGVGGSKTDSWEKAEEGAEETATVASGRAAVIPISQSPSLTLSAHIGLGNTRILPALPRLFTTPHVYPEHAPNSLRLLPLSAIPRMTYCHHTHTDVFATMKKSYERLGLLHDESKRMLYVVNSSTPPAWAVLIGTLVPQLAKFMPLPVAPAESANAASVSSGLEDAHAAAARRLFASMDEGGLYCRDGAYDLAMSPSSPDADPRPGASRVPLTTAWTLRNAGLPALSATANITKEDDDGVPSDGKGCRWCTFAASRYVPPDIRAPPAGVVTDRNLCRGTFAFLAVGVEDPVSMAEQQMCTEALPERVATPVKSTTDGQPSVKDVAHHSPEDKPSEAPPAEYTVRVKAALEFWRRLPYKALKRPTAVSNGAPPPP
ncbi:hypothetical protein JKF63_05957 [Porcisia hertigi]|uniref:RNase III domain-containing protein n=1 Tax=Porcisia hertigi TaxID=2761500 RepID=A0A836IBL6_9TRYP|nr:hypothetical protein JKF63_05957 [Porcisia hertigi]